MREEITHLFNNLNSTEIIENKSNVDNSVHLRYGVIREHLRGRKKSFLESQKTYDAEQRVRFLSSFDTSQVACETLFESASVLVEVD